MKPGIVQRIFENHFPAIDAARRLDPRSRCAAWNIRTCRTPTQGYHIDECPNGDYRIRLNNSCRHRACPMCGATETELWLERQTAKELRCGHHQLVFTSPDVLRAIWRWNRRVFTNLYFLAAWHSLRELLASPQWLGVLPGVIAVFQSWGDELQEHLHLHFILTCGGLTPDGKWINGNPEYLLPVAVLAAKFRGKFLAYLREAFKTHTVTGKPKPNRPTPMNCSTACFPTSPVICVQSATHGSSPFPSSGPAIPLPGGKHHDFAEPQCLSPFASRYLSV